MNKLINGYCYFTEQGYDERGLTAWSDSMIHAWDQVSFSDSESEEEEELLHEIPQVLFRDLNRRLDHDMLSRVNLYFERLFDLAGQPLSYREAEEIVVSAQSDVSILRNIISCQQQHNEALRHAAEFWRSCHEQLYNEFRQFQQSMIGIPEKVREQRMEQRLTVNALSSMGERLNLIQRMLSELYDRMMTRRPLYSMYLHYCLLLRLDFSFFVQNLFWLYTDLCKNL